MELVGGGSVINGAYPSSFESTIKKHKEISAERFVANSLILITNLERCLWYTKLSLLHIISNNT